MLKPIHKAPCAPALAACQHLMQTFALWLCDTKIRANDINSANLRAKMPSQIEADWLWQFLDRLVKSEKLLARAKSIADLSVPEKQELASWINTVANIQQYFGAAPPPALPITLPNGWASRKAMGKTFSELFVSFYTIGFKKMGLPYNPVGMPTAVSADWVTYKVFVDQFCAQYRHIPDPNCREVCVLCGSELGKPEVDHWINKSAFPLLSICADNLLPICGSCNSSDNKGQKPVHTNGNFADWYHPYLRPVNGTLELSYDLHTCRVKCTTAQIIDQPKVDNLDHLLNLTSRWTREFKAEYSKKQRELLKLKQRARGPNDHNALQAWIADFCDGLLDSEPHYEVHKALGNAMLDAARVAAWARELELPV